MARDPGAIQLEIESLKKLRASGFKAVQEGENRLEHKSDAELVRAIASLEAELREASGSTVVRNVTVRCSPCKGW